MTPSEKNSTTNIEKRIEQELKLFNLKRMVSEINDEYRREQKSFEAQPLRKRFQAYLDGLTEKLHASAAEIPELVSLSQQPTLVFRNRNPSRDEGGPLVLFELDKDEQEQIVRLRSVTPLATRPEIELYIDGEPVDPEIDSAEKDIDFIDLVYEGASWKSFDIQKTGENAYLVLLET